MDEINHLNPIEILLNINSQSQILVKRMSGDYFWVYP